MATWYSLPGELRNTIFEMAFVAAAKGCSARDSHMRVLTCSWCDEDEPMAKFAPGQRQILEKALCRDCTKYREAKAKAPKSKLPIIRLPCSKPKKYIEDLGNAPKVTGAVALLLTSKQTYSEAIGLLASIPPVAFGDLKSLRAYELGTCRYYAQGDDHLKNVRPDIAKAARSIVVGHHLAPGQSHWYDFVEFASDSLPKLEKLEIRLTGDISVETWVEQEGDEREIVKMVREARCEFPTVTQVIVTRAESKPDEKSMLMAKRWASVTVTETGGESKTDERRLRVLDAVNEDMAAMMKKPVEGLYTPPDIYEYFRQLRVRQESAEESD